MGLLHYIFHHPLYVGPSSHSKWHARVEIGDVGVRCLLAGRSYRSAATSAANLIEVHGLPILGMAGRACCLAVAAVVALGFHAAIRWALIRHAVIDGARILGRGEAAPLRAANSGRNAGLRCGLFSSWTVLVDIRSFPSALLSIESHSSISLSKSSKHLL